jgi:hypothetical protein
LPVSEDKATEPEHAAPTKSLEEQNEVLYQRFSLFKPYRESVTMVAHTISSLVKENASLEGAWEADPLTAFLFRYLKWVYENEEWKQSIKKKQLKEVQDDHAILCAMQYSIEDVKSHLTLEMWTEMLKRVQVDGDLRPQPPGNDTPDAAGETETEATTPAENGQGERASGGVSPVQSPKAVTSGKGSVFNQLKRDVSFKPDTLQIKEERRKNKVKALLKVDPKVQEQNEERSKAAMEAVLARARRKRAASGEAGADSPKRQRYSQWKQYKKQITTLTRHVRLLIDAREEDISAIDLQELLNTNPLTLAVYTYFTCCLDDNEMMDEVYTNYSSLHGDECIVMDAMEETKDTGEQHC